MRKTLTLALFLFVLIGIFSPLTCSAQYKTWNDVVDDMEKHLNSSYTTYTKGDADKAKEQVDVAYFGFYEKLGFEKTVMAYISGRRAATVEYQFAFVKKAMTMGAPNAEVKEGLDLLKKYLREDANQLDGKKESEMGIFMASLLIIVREGFEAIIIVGAIIAYLIKSGNQDKVKPVYIGTLLALVASVLLAVALNMLTGLAGANQEIIEGVTMLIAVVVLFYVSNWMFAKAEAENWSRYIEGKVQSSLSQGSVYSMAFAAFLAVFREGAETILFYQALFAGTQTYFNMIWAGIGVGVVILVIIYILIRYLSIKLPLKPFFVGTSVLLCVMAISFLGTGIKELQEGNVISVTAFGGFESIDLLGIYPTLETLVPQIILLVISVITFGMEMRKWGNNKNTDIPA